MFDVYITKSGKYLPNKVISNDEMENFLGLINEATSKARRIILRNNKIVARYYAIDENGNSTHSNAELTKNAITELFDESFTAQDMQLLSCGTSTPDVFLPSHAAMVHGLLKNKSVELNSSTGVCCAGMNSLKFGYLSVKSGNTKNAVCTGSEKVSTWMKSEKYEQEVANLKHLEEQPIVAFKKDFLRWMLSDGAAAFLLENEPKGERSLKIEWMEAFSYAHELEVCMYAGGDKLENGELKPWSDYHPEQWLNESIFSIKQDVKLLDKNILIKGAQSMKEALDKNKVSADQIDYFLPHVSSHYFVEGLKKSFAENGMVIPSEKWFMNLAQVGNVGSASIYLALNELMNSETLKKGDKILLSVPESGRFSYAYAYLTVC
ncbi:TPA: beta-ketoacyl-ACP synthase III [Flavobacterium psychrophilum]|uniref:beta-ketoacyl-ACP synthase III n=1 Tax=Flavobacterium psychrophilum TaxID=96345 RepID=UPI00073E5DF5|nr:beta-ketoacyl-ACP synthase III [Flavobacterium psychrophilum]EKT3957416.1 beta-ketoacyl-ACP synthase III [Flavobacterium psychrophilum]EKT4490391.1 beta-ketoacyl-ACP synthase III [Flavobacterium psychrophilum]MEB3379198.1 beta-ketoacyl-ACP synthase III [Flavobacterium psychrophilum]SNB15352.1 3-oxoacyl-(acyl-carrier-protein) synthase III protein DarB [Flavobacterium psychrophilum]SNB95292.1 3-oxoacyl-(acyl-carrier-protein) synthase III protein DarB [Flavobacterium psychrophilum]